MKIGFLLNPIHFPYFIMSQHKSLSMSSYDNDLAWNDKKCVFL